MCRKTVAQNNLTSSSPPVPLDNIVPNEPQIMVSETFEDGRKSMSVIRFNFPYYIERSVPHVEILNEGSRNYDKFPQVGRVFKIIKN